MIIAVNTSCPAAGFTEGMEEFITECFSRLAKYHPQHRFIYVSDKPLNERFSSAENITGIVAGPEAKNPLLWQYWYNYKLPAVLRKQRVDVFFSANGICSLRTRVPQCLLLPGPSFLQHPQLFAKNGIRFYKRFTAKFLAKAKTAVALSIASQTGLVKQYKTDAGKIDVISSGINEAFVPVLSSQKETIKEQYADGKEYFLFTGKLSAPNNLLNLLKAFSFFKKRQKSNMLLLLAATETGNEFSAALSTFKFRNEVRVLTGLPQTELAAITAAAYAFVYPVSYTEGYTLPPLEAMQSGVPVICSHIAPLTEYCGEAALYCNPVDFNDIAEHMMLLYKDEKKHKELASAGKIRSQQYSWDKTAAELWQILSKTIQ